MRFEEAEYVLNIYKGILRQNPSFRSGKPAAFTYRFDCPEYKTLAEKYDLARIAGRGGDSIRAIRLMKHLAPRLKHDGWYDGHIEGNALALLDYSLDQPEHGINCLWKSKILQECCMAVGIRARRVLMMPYSPFDFDNHVVTEVYARDLGKWIMLDTTTNGYCVDEHGTILSLLEMRDCLASDRFMTFRPAPARTKDLQTLYRRHIDLNYYYAKNLFWFYADAVSCFGDTDEMLYFLPEHFSVIESRKANFRYRIDRLPAEYSEFAGQYEEKLRALETTPEPDASPISTLTDV